MQTRSDYRLLEQLQRLRDHEPIPVEAVCELHRAVEAHLDAFLRQQQTAMHTPGRLDADFYRLAAAFTLRRSKRLRALLTLLTYQALEPAPAVCDEALLSVTTALEILHAAILIHDDVIDHDLVRGGAPTLPAQLAQAGYGPQGASAAVLAGDALAALAPLAVLHASMAPHTRTHVLSRLGVLTAQTAHGQAEELYLTARRPGDLGNGQLETAAVAKMHPTTTECGLLVGGILAGASQQTLDRLAACGQPVALAFQILNDLAAYHRSRKQPKPRPEPRSILLVLRAAHTPSPPSVQRELEDFAAGQPGCDPARTLAHVAASGAEAALRRQVEELFAQAHTLLDAVPAAAAVRQRLGRVLNLVHELYAPGSGLYAAIGRQALPVGAAS